MPNQQTLQGNWNEIKGKLRSKWGQLTGDDVASFGGNVDQLIGLIQRKTGESRESIEHYLDEITMAGAGAIGQRAEEARQYARYAGGKIQEGSRRAAESMRASYEGAERVVRERPGQSAAVCFGAGVLTGLMLGILMRGR